MFTTIVTLLLAGSALAIPRPQNIDDAPACAQRCLARKYTEVGSLAPNCGATDLSCLCSTQSFTQAYENCMRDHCTGADLAQGILFAQQLCANVGVGAGTVTAVINADASSSVAAVISSLTAGVSSSISSVSSEAAANASSSAVAAASSSIASVTSALGASQSSAAASLSSVQSALSASLSAVAASASSAGQLSQVESSLSQARASASSFIAGQQSSLSSALAAASSAVSSDANTLHRPVFGMGAALLFAFVFAR